MKLAAVCVQLELPELPLLDDEALPGPDNGGWLHTQLPPEALLTQLPRPLSEADQTGLEAVHLGHGQESEAVEGQRPV